MISKKDDYAYIQVFIDYLKQIIDIIVALFNGMGNSSAGKEEDKTEAEPAK